MNTPQKRRPKQQTAKRPVRPPKVQGPQRTGAPRTKNRRTQPGVKSLRPRQRTRLNVGRIALIGVSVAFIAWAIYPITYKMEQAKELEHLNAQLARLNRENKELREDLKELSSDDYVEQQARALGLSRPDEEIVVVVPEKQRAPLKDDLADAEKNEQSKRSQPLWTRLSTWLSGIF